MKPSAWAHMSKLPGAVWWVAGATLVNRMGSMVFPFLVLYFHRGLKMDLETSAGIAAFYGAGGCLAGPLGGWASDRFDCTRILAFSLGAGGAVMVLFTALQQPLSLMVFTFLMALLADLSRPATMTSIARLAGPDQSRDAFTLNYLAINLGMSVGPTLGGYLAVHDYRWLFWVDGGSSIVACLLLLLSRIRCPAVATHAAPADWNVGWPAFRMLFFLAPTLWVFATFFSASPVYGVDNLHLRESDVGWLWLINTLVIVASTVHVNHWSRGRSLTSLLSLASACLAACYGALYFIPGVAGLVVAILFLTVGEMMMFTNSSAYLQKVVPESKLGRAIALSALCSSCAMTLASPTVGYFFTHQTPALMWAVLAATAALAALGFSRLKS